MLPIHIHVHDSIPPDGNTILVTCQHVKSLVDVALATDCQFLTRPLLMTALLIGLYHQAMRTV